MLWGVFLEYLGNIGLAKRTLSHSLNEADIFLPPNYIFFHMMTSSNGNIFRVTGSLCGEFTDHRWISRIRPVTPSFDVSFDLRPNNRLSKQSRDRWFQTPSRSLWCYRNELSFHIFLSRWFDFFALGIIRSCKKNMSYWYFFLMLYSPG